MITWVVGRGGLLGSAVARHCGREYLPGPVPWSDPENAREALHAHARGLEIAADGGDWRVIWAAGASTTSTPRDMAMAELVPFEGLLSGLRSALPHGRGSVFVASSAGGVYAGSFPPPFDIRSETVPLSPYGELKLAQEQLAHEVLGPVVPVAIGRISNLYGPGQNLDKLQGLVSRLALSAVTQQPINIFVPLETIRDYIYVDDAAREALRAADRARERGSSTTQVVASGQPATVGQLIRTMNLVARRRVPVALGSHASAAAQSADLRLVPTTVPEQLTTLPAGMKAVYTDILTRMQQSSLAG